MVTVSAAVRWTAVIPWIGTAVIPWIGETRWTAVIPWIGETPWIAATGSAAVKTQRAAQPFWPA